MDFKDTNDLDSWGGIVDNYLKALNLKDDKGKIVVEDLRVVDRTTDDGQIRKQMEVITTIDGVEYLFPLNWTNSNFIKTQVTTPREIIGRSLEYEKIRVKNPITNQLQDGISIVGVSKTEKL